MSEHRKLIAPWVITLVLVLAIGFGMGASFSFYKASVKFPLDTDKITLLAENSQSSRTQVVNVYRTNGQEKSFEISATEFRDLLLTLAPIEGSRTGVMWFPNYQLGFQTRMDPTVIYVEDLGPFNLQFEIQGIIYTGGNSSEFKRRIEAIIKASRVNPPAPTPADRLESN